MRQFINCVTRVGFLFDSAWTVVAGLLDRLEALHQVHPGVQGELLAGHQNAADPPPHRCTTTSQIKSNPNLLHSQ